MAADPTPMAADEYWNFASIPLVQTNKVLLAAIGVGSAFIGVSKDFGFRQPRTASDSPVR
jgi:hypothetical protein